MRSLNAVNRFPLKYAVEYRTNASSIVKSTPSDNSGATVHTGKSVPSTGFGYTKEFGERLTRVIDSVGSLTKAGEIARVTDEQVARWRDGLSKPNFFGLGNLCLEAGYSLDWVLTGKGSPTPAIPDHEMSQLYARLARNVGVDPQLRSEDANLPSDFRLIPRLEVTAAAGPGSLVEYEQPVEMLAFRSDWLRSRGINPLTAHVLTARGDSMEPTIRDGDILLVDTSIDRVMDNAIYVVEYSGRTLVKRVQLRLDGSVVLKSDNQAIFDDEAVPHGEVARLNVAGRVMWYGRSI